MDTLQTSRPVIRSTDPPPRDTCGQPKWRFVLLSAALMTLVLSMWSSRSHADEPFRLNRCEVIPLPDNQVSFRFLGVEKLRWNFGKQHPRPFFYPVRGPSGSELTRMGHPGAQNHDHHLSMWFAHKGVDGQDFWSMSAKSQVRQKMWYAYHDDDFEGVMASLCGWYDPDGRELMEQDLIVALIPLPDDEHAIEIQITLRPSGKSAAVELDQTNFGFFAIRVAKTISVHFGGGTLTDSEGRISEPEIFGNQARWMDYSGPVAVESGINRSMTIEGLTYFDHPSNPRYPSHWHVRSDGWMGAAFNLNEAYTITADNPLTLRYLVHAHSGYYDSAKARGIHESFAIRPGFEVIKSTKKHRQYEVRRLLE